jgi:hypothetical protein
VGENVPIECVVSEAGKDAGISARSVADFFEGKVL